MGTSAKFFDAIMGYEISKEQLEEYSEADNLLTLGEIGCALSHLGTYRRLLDTEEKCAFIFEDDTCLTEEFIAVQQNLSFYGRTDNAFCFVALSNSRS